MLPTSEAVSSNLNSGINWENCRCFFINAQLCGVRNPHQLIEKESLIDAEKLIKSLGYTTTFVLNV